MKATRKTVARRKPKPRRSAALSITARVERLEKLPHNRDALFTPRVAKAPSIKSRFVNLDAQGRPTTGDHVAVYDRQLQLTWTAAPLAGGKGMKHGDAMQACADLTLLGQTGWRGPTVQELLSIIDYERNAPAVDVEHFIGPFGWTWTSTAYKGTSGAAWLVDLDDGYSFWYYRNYECLARAVRAGQILGLTE